MYSNNKNKELFYSEKGNHFQPVLNNLSWIYEKNNNNIIIIWPGFAEGLMLKWRPPRTGSPLFSHSKKEIIISLQSPSYLGFHFNSIFHNREKK